MCVSMSSLCPRCSICSLHSPFSSCPTSCPTRTSASREDTMSLISLGKAAATQEVGPKFDRQMCCLRKVWIAYDKYVITITLVSCWIDRTTWTAYKMSEANQHQCEAPSCRGLTLTCRQSPRVSILQYPPRTPQVW